MWDNELKGDYFGCRGEGVYRWKWAGCKNGWLVVLEERISSLSDLSEVHQDIINKP